MITLRQDNLRELPDGVLRPTYDRASLSPGIVHIGVGNFHRAHQAWYLHQLFQKGWDLDWAILGAGVRPFDRDQRARLLAQDGLTTLIELAPDRRRAEVTGSMIGYIPVTPDNQPLITRMAAPDIRIVALTVTEGGYYLDPIRQTLDQSHPDIQHDATHPERPKTAFGAMIAALKMRRDGGVGPFTGLSCDNLQSNGDALRRAVVSLARLSDPALADWINTTCSFPNGMVDCIVPATGPAELALAQSLGIDDTAPVTHENFRQWVIEDDFCAGRPALEEVGVTFVANVHDHEAMKIRILNGGHQIIANPGELLACATIADCMNHPKIAALFDRIARQDIAPHVRPTADFTPATYVDLITARFSNPAIGDTTRRVAFDGSSRHPGFVLPSLRDGLAQGTPTLGLTLAEALWARMCAGTREDGSEISANDPHWDSLQPLAHAARNDPGLWLAQSQIYGDLAADDRVSGPFANWLAQIWSEGTEAAIDRYLAS